MTTPKSANKKRGGIPRHMQAAQSLCHQNGLLSSHHSSGVVREGHPYRIIRIGLDVENRQGITEAAKREIDSEGRESGSRIEFARLPLTRIQMDIRNLVQVLTHTGAEGIASVGDELKELEEEQSRLQAEIKGWLSRNPRPANLKNLNTSSHRTELTLETS
ncbi:hypothetical protein [Planctomicrobium sp. SH664]|uniref:hypothetical protein n=1 Tax=Planctomicrobium sp. SH664 TaxID=3448125 RepID=UPI003F5C33DA